MKEALGLIETTGKISAVVAMDAAVKSADVTIISLENSRGGGRMTVKFVGEVSAVKAASEAGIAAVDAMGGNVYAHKVIARPSEQLDDLLEATKGCSYLESWHQNEKKTVMDIDKATACMNDLSDAVAAKMTKNEEVKTNSEARKKNEKTSKEKKTKENKEDKK